MEESQFYITLPSNSSVKIFPQNTVSNFMTKLSQTVTLTGEWEVGLSEIQYARSWYNMRKRNNWIYVSPARGKPFFAKDIPQGFYSSIHPVINFINRILSQHSQEARDNVKINYDEVSARIKIDIKNGATLTFSSDVAVILGFETPFERAITQPTESPFAPNVHLGMYSLYVYCDIVQVQMVGDSQVPLLRVVPIEGQHGEYITRTYQSPQYLPVSRKAFDSIEIDIKDDTGNSIPFESGKSMVTLHFRLKHSPYFN